MTAALIASMTRNPGSDNALSAGVAIAAVMIGAVVLALVIARVMIRSSRNPDPGDPVDPEKPFQEPSPPGAPR